MPELIFLRGGGLTCCVCSSIWEMKLQVTSTSEWVSGREIWEHYEFSSWTDRGYWQMIKIHISSLLVQNIILQPVLHVVHQLTLWGMRQKACLGDWDLRLALKWLVKHAYLVTSLWKELLCWKKPSTSDLHTIQIISLSCHTQPLNLDSSHWLQMVIATFKGLAIQPWESDCWVWERSSLNVRNRKPEPRWPVAVGQSQQATLCPKAWNKYA